MQIFFFYLSAFLKSVCRKWIFSRFFVSLLLFSRFTQGDVKILNWAFLSGKKCKAACLNRYISGDTPRSVFLLCGFIFLRCVSVICVHAFSQSFISRPYKWHRTGNPATRTDAFVMRIFLFFTLALHSRLVSLQQRWWLAFGGGVGPQCIVSSVPAGSFGETVWKVGWSEYHTVNKLSQTGRRRREVVCPCERNRPWYGALHRTTMEGWTGRHGEWGLFCRCTAMLEEWVKGKRRLWVRVHAVAMGTGRPSRPSECRIAALRARERCK